MKRQSDMDFDFYKGKRFNKLKKLVKSKSIFCLTVLKALAIHFLIQHPECCSASTTITPKNVTRKLLFLQVLSIRNFQDLMEDPLNKLVQQRSLIKIPLDSQIIVEKHSQWAVTRAWIVKIELKFSIWIQWDGSMLKTTHITSLDSDYINIQQRALPKGCYGSLGPFLTKISRTLTIISRTFEIDQYLSDLDHYLSDLSNWPKSLGPIAKISRSLLANISRTISKKVSRTSYDIFFHFVTKLSPRRAQKGKPIYFLSDCVPKSVRTP